MNLLAIPLLLSTVFGSNHPASPQEPDQPAKPSNAAVKDTFEPDAAWKPLGQSLWFDAEGRRLLLRAKVVLREGPLEHLLCLKGTKEHEAIVSTNAAPRSIHAGLLLTGAEPGHPVKFLPKFVPPAGTALKIVAEWEEQGKTRSIDVREWIFNEHDKKPLETTWVFAGSEIVQDPFTKKPYYTAEDGDLITVANFANAILDLPHASTASDNDRVYVARTEKIPPKGTWVTLIFTPEKPQKGEPGRLLDRK